MAEESISAVKRINAGSSLDFVLDEKITPSDQWSVLHFDKSRKDELISVVKESGTGIHKINIITVSRGPLDESGCGRYTYVRGYRLLDPLLFSPPLESPIFPYHLIFESKEPPMLNFDEIFSKGGM